MAPFLNHHRSRMFLISPSQVVSQSSTFYHETSGGFNQTVSVDYDKSEAESIDEQNITNPTKTQINISQSMHENNPNENQEEVDKGKLPQLITSYSSKIEVDIIDPLKFKFQEDKPYPLKLLNSKHIQDALEHIKRTGDETKYIRKIYVYIFWIYYCIKFQNDILSQYSVKNLREKLKIKYMKLFVLTPQPKDELFEVFPFLIGKAVYLTIEKHLKNGKLILSNNDEVENELFQIVHQELNGFTMSHIYLAKNMKKYLINQASSKFNINLRNNALRSINTNEFITTFKTAQKNSQQNLQKDSDLNNSAIKKKSSLRRVAIQQEQKSKEVQSFKSQLKRIMDPPLPEKKKQSQTNKIRNELPANKTSRLTQTHTWQWFGQEQTSVMSQTARFNKFETGKLSPMFTSFYSANSFTNPISKKNIVLKKHITQSEERPESNFEMLLRAYRKDKIRDIEEMKKNNKYQLKGSNIRTLNKILGKEASQKPIKEFVVKRRIRKWIVGQTLSPDGNILTSPGLQKLVELKHAVDKLPTNFNFEKKLLRSSFPKRLITTDADIGNQYSELADSLLPEYRDLLLQSSRNNENNQSGDKIQHYLSAEALQRKQMQERFTKKMRKILRQKSERELQRKEELTKEEQSKIKEKQKKLIESAYENYQAAISQPFIKDEDVEYWFENIFQEYAEENLKKKKTSIGSIKQLSLSKIDKNTTSSNSFKVNPFRRTQEQIADDQWEPQSKPQNNKQNSYLKRKDLVFKGTLTPKHIKVNEDEIQYEGDD